MDNTKRVLGVITARGGSKGIVNKNIKDLCGKPLIAHTIEVAKNSKKLTDLVVSTDSEEIADIARQYGANTPFLRPEELSGDKSSSIDAIKHTIEWFKQEKGLEYDYVMILQPTSPLRTAEDIDSCIDIAIETNADSVMSMVELTDFSLKKLKKINGDDILPLIEDEGKESERRDVGDKVYKRNGVVYLTKTDSIMQDDLFGKISKAYIMPEERSVDINTLFDFKLAEFLKGYES